MPARNGEIQNPDVVAALDRAARGDLDPLFATLSRQSHMPGPHPNEALARALAGALFERGAAGHRIIWALADLGPDDAPAGSAVEFLPYCGAYALAVVWQHASADAGKALDRLETFAEDPRRTVRGAVISALTWAAGGDAGRLLDEVAGWMNGYLQATSVLDLLRQRTVLDGLHQPSRLIERLDQAFQLLDDAPRAHQRSHGYRSLARALGETIGVALARYGDPIASWAEERIAPSLATPVDSSVPGTTALFRVAPIAAAGVDGRSVMEAAVAIARQQGTQGGLAARISNALAASAKERRDPRTYVGPTRQRAEKAGGRARRSPRR